MIKIENTITPSNEQWLAIINGMRNPLNSWDRIDSKPLTDGNIEIGENDLKLMKQLAKAGTDHRKFMRMITVYADITAPRYYWTEFDTYKVGTVANSCSTMHTIHKKEFTIDDFSHDKIMLAEVELFNRTVNLAFDNLIQTISTLNSYRQWYLETKDKRYWDAMIQLLPQSYNQKRTVMLNYEVLANMYHSRKSHKLDEWRTFCKWVDSLPYSELITHTDGKMGVREEYMRICQNNMRCKENPETCGYSIEVSSLESENYFVAGKDCPNTYKNVTR